MEKTIALIAAKGNSERIPKKNIRIFGNTKFAGVENKSTIKCSIL